MIESVVGGLPGRHRRSKVESWGLGIRREQLAYSDHVVAQPSTFLRQLQLHARCTQ